MDKLIRLERNDTRVRPDFRIRRSDSTVDFIINRHAGLSSIPAMVETLEIAGDERLTRSSRTRFSDQREFHVSQSVSE